MWRTLASSADERHLEAAGHRHAAVACAEQHGEPVLHVPRGAPTVEREPAREQARARVLQGARLREHPRHACDGAVVDRLAPRGERAGRALAPAKRRRRGRRPQRRTSKSKGRRRRGPAPGGCRSRRRGKPGPGRPRGSRRASGGRKRPPPTRRALAGRKLERRKPREQGCHHRRACAPTQTRSRLPAHDE